MHKVGIQQPSHTPTTRMHPCRPTSGLDSETALQVVEQLAALAREDGRMVRVKGLGRVHSRPPDGAATAVLCSSAPTSHAAGRGGGVCVREHCVTRCGTPSARRLC